MDDGMYDILCATLDQLCIAIFILGPDCKLLFANGAGKAILLETSPVFCADGHLHGRDRESSQELLRGLEAVLGDSGGGAAESVDYEVCLAHASENKAGAIGYLRCLRSKGDTEPVAALFIARTGQGGLFGIGALAKSFDLSKAETRVLKQLIKAHTPTAAAAHLHLSIYTVKSHMRKIFQKTGTSSQAELVRLVECFRVPIQDARTGPERSN